MKKKLIFFSIVILLIAAVSVYLFAVKNNESSDIETDSTQNNEEVAQFQDEDETLELKTQKVDDSFFFGTWSAESDRAAYMYGNVTITINEDGTWEGNITEEDIHGKWEHHGDGIRLTSDVIPFNMVYSSNNNVVLQETDDAVRVVLTKQ